MALPEWVMVVAGEVDVEVLNEWNTWYDEVHLPEIVDCPGFERATRYVGGDDVTAFVTIYELSSRDAMQTPEFAERRGFGPVADRVRAKTRLYHRHLALEGADAGRADRGS
jgi:hypothetical protein